MFAQALEICPGVTAVIGGGGKTTLLRTLGEELAGPARVLLCTTTKIYPFPGVPTAYSRRELEALSACPLVCAGTPLESGKLTVPEVPLAELAKGFDYVLVEADGSAGRPLKAHDAHEPAVPPEAGQTILVVGASGLGRPIIEAAHRPALYARLAGAALTDAAAPALAARVIGREALHTRVFINQAETAPAFSAELAALLCGPVCRGSLKKGEITSCSF